MAVHACVEKWTRAGRRCFRRAFPRLLVLSLAIACNSGGPAGTGPEPPGSNNVPPAVTVTGATTVDAGQPVTVSVRATDDDGLTRVVIAWGDGTEDSFDVGGVPVFETSATHTYARVGTFRVEATATDSRSTVGSAQLSITTRGGRIDFALEHAPGSAHLIARVTITVGNIQFLIRDGEERAAHDLVPGDHQVTIEPVREDCELRGDAVRIVHVEAGEAARVDLSIDCVFVPEERIVYNTIDDQGFSSDIYSARPDGSERRRLTNRPPGTDYPKWSPDGTRILFEDFVRGNREIWIMNYDGTAAVRVGNGGRPAWSPDGRRVAFELQDDLAVADLEGGALANVTFLTRDGDTLDDEGPSWSPDGSTIAFHRADVIHLIAPDGSDLRALVPGVAAVWMPGGDRLVFRLGDRRQIATMRSDGTDVKVLTDLADGAGHPYPSPDGDRIVFTSTNRIWVMNADGSDPHVVEAIPPKAGHASWSR